MKAGDQSQVQPAEAHAGAHHLPASSPGSKPGTSQSTRSAAGMNIVAARYVLDFGYVIKGASKVKQACSTCTTPAETLCSAQSRAVVASTPGCHQEIRLVCTAQLVPPVAKQEYCSISTAPLHSVRPPQHNCVDKTPVQIVQPIALPLLFPFVLDEMEASRALENKLVCLQPSGNAVRPLHHTT